MPKQLQTFRKKFKKNHITKVENYFSEKGDFLHIYNIDDYHNIHEIRRPNSVSTSTAKHFATCVTKLVANCFAYLLNKYGGIFDIIYIECQSLWNHDNNVFDTIELLTVHSYDDAIAERKEEKSMNGLQLVSFKEQHLHSMQDYLNALQMILDINGKTKHLENQVVPVIANWPGQLFIRKALTHFHASRASGSQSTISQEIESFVPMLGPLHLSLNSREHVMIIYHSFFEQMFYFVFGKNKKLAKKPKP
ncbi:hypothetical protein GLOIN_2v1783033 [Rhizophagus clarus]|uniref:Uncharacterized protein n=1 Tax=Rhizophagus clarus TaxID=94130 RepID=A0A8H3QFM4_9GLOM|nr:hypothetical protein GLOIN_2v1783033 [Rhizophagus clarus]